MPRNLGLAAVCLALLGFAGLASGGRQLPGGASKGNPAAAAGTTTPGPAPDTPAKTRPHFSHILTLPSSDVIETKLDAAAEYLKGGDWRLGAAVLQSILDHPEDCFVPMARPGKDGKAAVGWVSARAEATRMLGTFPPKGREAYEVAYGRKAAALLDEAKKQRDVGRLAEIVARYLHTRAGGAAADLLGTHFLDRGQYAMAAVCFARLIARPGDDELSPLTLYKACVALYRNQDRARAEQAWKRLEAKAPKGIEIGGKTVALASLREQLERPGAAGPTPSAEWLLFRGDAARSAQSGGGTPAPEARWSNPTVQENVSRTWVEGAARAQDERGQPTLTASVPIATPGRIFYRSQRGVHAVERATGKLLWESQLGGGLDSLANDSAVAPHVGSWAAIFLQSFPHVFTENGTIGTLSTDRKQLYLIEDLAVPPAPQNYGGFAARGGSGLELSFAPELTNAVYHNKLLALDLESGLILWEAGGRGVKKDRPLNDTHFLGPPLPVAGRLYVLAEKDQMLRLVCLDPARGRMLWSQPLAQAKNNVLLDGGRRTWGGHLAHADGALICSTDAGGVVAVDLVTQGLLWAYSYRDEVPPPPVKRPGKGGRIVIRPQPVAPTFNLNSTWKFAAPLIHDGKVLLAAPDSLSLDCVSLHTGELLWRENRQDDDVYVAGVFQGRVVIVGRQRCRALALADGRPLWNVETGLPAGMGAAAGGTYYLPVKRAAGTDRAEVQEIDLARGAVVRRTPFPAGEAPGNLLFHEGDVIVQTPTAVTVYPQGKGKDTK